VINFTDQNQGLQSSSVDDFVVWRRDGIASYHLACVVDDHDLGVTEVLRGADLVPSTFRQLALYRTLDWKEPDYLHLPLVVTEAGERLEKRHGLPGIAALRDRGVKLETLYGWVLSALTGQNMKSISQHDFLRQLPSPPWRRLPVVVPEVLR
jgi:glutamyl/glutaminyl-tRNA synthetase